MWGSLDALRVLVYGDSGTGKTTFWSSFPGPIRVFLCSGGDKPGELLSVHPADRKKMHPIPIKSSAQIYEELEKPGDFQTNVLDHATGLLGLVCMEHLKLDRIPAVKKWGMAPQRDWGFINENCIDLFRGMLNAPGNVVIVAQETVFKAREEGIASDVVKPAIGAAVTPGISKWLNPACDYVLQSYKRPRIVKNKRVDEVAGQKVVTETEERKGVEYCLRTEPHDIFMTKCRAHGRPLPDAVVLGNSVEGVDRKTTGYQKLLAVIRGEE